MPSSVSGARGRARARGLLEQAQRHLLIGLARNLHHEQTLRGVCLVLGLGLGLGLGLRGWGLGQGQVG